MDGEIAERVDRIAFLARLDDELLGKFPIGESRHAKHPRRDTRNRRRELLCPFFELSFDLLRQDGQLGFIVSNAFAKREFGKALVENFFSTVHIQKIVDCSGLMFPGHGTPTCIVFGAQQKPNVNGSIRVSAVLAGGGDLRTPPEESPLWHSLSLHHDELNYADRYIAVADRPRDEMNLHPWNFDPSGKQLQDRLEGSNPRLNRFLPGKMGVSIVTLANEIYAVPPHVFRKAQIPTDSLVPYVPGENVRNWSWEAHEVAIFPYTKEHKVRNYENSSAEHRWFKYFKEKLDNRIYFGKTPAERGMKWYEYGVVVWQNCDNPNKLIFPDLATHAHFTRVAQLAAFNQHTPVLALRGDASESELHLCSGFVNSSTALFWLKQVCFNKGAGEDEERDRFEYQGNDVEQLPVPSQIAAALSRKQNSLADTLMGLALACWQHGLKIPGLALKRMFEKTGEAYEEWNTNLPGRVATNSEFDRPFDSVATLLKAYAQTRSIRDLLCNEMIALQEEIDWLIYAAYGLLPEVHPAAQVELEPAPLEREQRPFRLFARAAGDFGRAVELVPSDWPASRKTLWEARLVAIRDNDHIRRIEQPVYKRRWEEQWKVGNHWRYGSLAYAAEFVDAFEWWIREKAEWWLEKRKHGGPVEFDAWAQALWKDERVNAAWPVAAEEYTKLKYDKVLQKAKENDEPAPSPIAPVADFVSFRRELKRILDEETVVENIPFGVSYEELEKKLKRKIPGNVSKVRGKLNVPRERFHLRDKTQYLWAGLQFKQ